jgi:DNA-binding LacI/PurR family transcriptional regulator
MANPQNVRCTLKHIAEIAGVSTATVSRVANGAESVSSRTRVRVESAMSQLKYRPNTLAAALARSNAGIPRKPRNGLFLPTKMTKPSHESEVFRVEKQSAEHVRLLEENVRLKRLLARLRRDLENS